MNIEKITTKVPIFGTTGSNAREHKPVKDLNALVNDGVNFDTYQIHEGETLKFPKFEDLEVEWVAVTKGSKRGYHIVKCVSEMDGRAPKVTWFGLPALSKRAWVEGNREDDFNTPIQPTWYDLGNNLERLKALAEVGEIHGTDVIEVMTPVFDADGNRIYEDVLDADGNQLLENGEPITRMKRKTQKVVIISAYEKPSAE